MLGAERLCLMPLLHPCDARSCAPCIPAAPIIALSMGERGLPCRILAPKFAGVLTFGALSAGRESAPGQPTVQQLRQLYRLPAQRASTQARWTLVCSMREGIEGLPPVSTACVSVCCPCTSCITSEVSRSKVC